VGGGFTYRAVTSVFSIVRTTTNDRAIEGRAGRQSFLEPGDVLTVYERRF
jgi:polysaccharide export outer membrane protein